MDGDEMKGRRAKSNKGGGTCKGENC